MGQGWGRQEKREALWFDLGKVSAEFESDEVACLTIDLNAEVVDVMISGGMEFSGLEE